MATQIEHENGIDYGIQRAPILATNIDTRNDAKGGQDSFHCFSKNIPVGNEGQRQHTVEIIFGVERNFRRDQ